LKCDDFLQNYQINITIAEMKVEEGKDREKSGVLYEIIGDRSKLNPQEDEVVANNGKSGDATNGGGEGPSTSKGIVEDDDDIEIVMEDEPAVVIETKAVGTKRRLEDKDDSLPKKRRVEDHFETEVIDID